MKLIIAILILAWAQPTFGVEPALTI